MAMGMMDAGTMDAGAMSPASAGGDLSQGYCIEVSVLPDGGFQVSGPGPLKTEEYTGEMLDSIGAALKAVIAIIKDNPVAGDDTAQMSAGYAAR
ncbi:MAG: hypothetical protein Q8R92_19760 [Deltaproteobacteria bacterium]|nr:hypothetical protein [Deltaproteobacteria bacterium]